MKRCSDCGKIDGEKYPDGVCNITNGELCDGCAHLANERDCVIDEIRNRVNEKMVCSIDEHKKIELTVVVGFAVLCERLKR